MLSAIQKVAKIRADFDDFDGDRRGIGDCLDEAEQELIVTINKYASQLAAEPIATNDVREQQTAVPPVPEIQDDVAQAIENLKQKLVECNRYNYCADAVKGVEDACHAAMLQGADASITHEGKNHHKDKLAMVDHSGDSNNMVEPVTTTYKLPFEQWLSKQTGTIDVECGCVMTEVFYHWLRVAYEAGNSPVTPDGWVIVPKELTPEMMRAVQIRSELGGYATSNLSGAYNMFSEFWNVAVSAAPKVDDL